MEVTFDFHLESIHWSIQSYKILLHLFQNDENLTGAGQKRRLSACRLRLHGRLDSKRISSCFHKSPKIQFVSLCPLASRLAYFKETFAILYIEFQSHGHQAGTPVTSFTTIWKTKSFKRVSQSFNCLLICQHKSSQISSTHVCYL